MRMRNVMPVLSALNTVSFFASASSTDSTITMPASLMAGDLAVLFDYAAGSISTPTDVVPTGWTGIATDSGGGSNRRLRVSRKILAGTESGSSVTGMNSSSEEKVVLVFRGDVAITGAVASTWNHEITQNNPASQSVTASGLATPLIVFGMAAVDGGTAAFSTASPAFDATVANSDSDLLCGYKIYNSSPANHTIDMADLGINGLASGYLVLS